MIKINYGKGYSDDTFQYIVTISRPMTVGEFIEEWLREQPSEWGYFGIYDGESVFGNPKCEYRQGRLTTAPLPTKYLNTEIDIVLGSGGWSRSDFAFKIRNKTEELNGEADKEAKK